MMLIKNYSFANAAVEVRGSAQMRLNVVLMTMGLVGCSAAPLQASDLLFDHPIQEISPGPEVTFVKADFTFANTSDRRVVVSSIKSSCGCTTAELEKREYQPGEAGVIPVVFTIGSRSGDQDKTISIKDDTGNEMVLRLKVHLPPGPMFSSTFVSWRQNGKPDTRTVTLVLPKGHTYTISKMIPSNPVVEVTSKPGFDDDTIVISFKPKNTDVPFNSTVDLKSSDGKVFTIFANVVPAQPAASP